MKNLLLMLFAVSIIMLSGCGPSYLIFKSGFSFSGSPKYLPPAASDEQDIRVFDQNNPIGNNSALVFNSNTSGRTLFVSRPITDSEAKKTIFLHGHLKTGNGPFLILISALNLPDLSGPLTSWLKLRIVNNVAQLYIKPNSSLAEVDLDYPKAIFQNEKHQIFVSLRPKLMSYYITMTQQGAPQLKWSGPLPASFVNEIKNHSHLVMEAKFMSTVGTNEYRMNSLEMKEIP